MEEQDFHYPYLLPSKTTAKGTGLEQTAGKAGRQALLKSRAMCETWFLTYICTKIWGHGLIHSWCPNPPVIWLPIPLLLLPPLPRCFLVPILLPPPFLQLCDCVPVPQASLPLPVWPHCRWLSLLPQLLPLQASTRWGLGLLPEEGVVTLMVCSADLGFVCHNITHANQLLFKTFMIRSRFPYVHTTCVCSKDGPRRTGSSAAICCAECLSSTLTQSWTCRWYVWTKAGNQYASWWPCLKNTSQVASCSHATWNVNAHKHTQSMFPTR